MENLPKIGSKVFLIHRDKGKRIIHAKVNTFIKNSDNLVVPEFSFGKHLYPHTNYNWYDNQLDALNQLRNN